MALSLDEQKLVDTLKKSGKTSSEVMRIVATRRTTGAETQQSDPTRPVGYIPQVKDAASAGIDRIKKAQVDTAAASQERLPNVVKAVEAGAEAGAGLAEIASAPLAPLLAPLAPYIAPILTKLKSLTSSVVGERIANDLANLASVAGLAAGAKLPTKLPPAADATATALKNTVDDAASLVDDAITSTKPLIIPTRTPEEAIAQIAQGKADDVKPMQLALETVDTVGVETFDQLQTRITDTIPTLAKQVDDTLSQDPKTYTLGDLSTKQSAKSGTVVTTDYISRALNDLSSLYEVIGDGVKRTDVLDLLNKAKANGLTRKEVNDISRTYGQEFGTKAFSKLGDPLTSTNAQAFENTRRGLKNVARQGLGGDEAKAIDTKLSALYDAQRLIQKNVEAVNKLQQRIQERGLLEKAGHYVSKYADIITGGSIRGFVGGMLPRGAGYKVMNALDIEAALRKNLDIVENALKQKSDDGFINALRQSTSQK